MSSCILLFNEGNTLSTHPKLLILEVYFFNSTKSTKVVFLFTASCTVYLYIVSYFIFSRKEKVLHLILLNSGIWEKNISNFG